MNSSSVLICALILILGVLPAYSEEIDKAPESLQGNLDSPLGLTQRFGKEIPKDLTFVDHRGQKIQLGKYFKGDLPVVLHLVYYQCPHTCTQLLENYVNSVKNLSFKMGKDYRSIAVSIDPRESFQLAKKSRQEFIKLLGYDPGHEGWSWHVGRKEAIDFLAESVGFGFRYQKDNDTFVHGAITMLISPDGKVTRYLDGLSVEPRDMKLALTETGEGKVGSVVDKMIRWCYSYDPKTSQYTLMASRLMMGAGALTVLTMGSLLFVLWRREFKRGSVS